MCLSIQFFDFGHVANPLLFLFRLLAFCLADNPAERTYALGLLNLFALALKTIKHAHALQCIQFAPLV